MASTIKSQPMTSSPLVTWKGSILPEWVDYNGHLRDAFYLLIFSFAGDKLMDLIGLDDAGRKQHGHSLFTLESHINYLQEVGQADEVEATAQILGFDSKRLHVFLALHRQNDPAMRACSEQMWINVDTTKRRSVAFAAEVDAQISYFAKAHELFPEPRYAGRVIQLPVR
jgi:acyl-CoA thioester hydrolase